MLYKSKNGKMLTRVWSLWSLMYNNWWNILFYLCTCWFIVNISPLSLTLFTCSGLSGGSLFSRHAIWDIHTTIVNVGNSASAFSSSHFCSTVHCLTDIYRVWAVAGNIFKSGFVLPANSPSIYSWIVFTNLLATSGQNDVVLGILTKDTCFFNQYICTYCTLTIIGDDKSCPSVATRTGANMPRYRTDSENVLLNRHCGSRLTTYRRKLQVCPLIIQILCNLHANVSLRPHP